MLPDCTISIPDREGMSMSMAHKQIIRSNENYIEYI